MSSAKLIKSKEPFWTPKRIYLSLNKKQSTKRTEPYFLIRIIWSSFYFLILGIALTIQLNGLLDFNKPSVQTAEVVNSEIDLPISNRHRRRKITIYDFAPTFIINVKGPDGLLKKYHTSFDMYHGISKRDTISIVSHSGALGISYQCISIE